MPSEQAPPTSAQVTRLAQEFQNNPASMAFKPLADAYIALGRTREAIDVLTRGLRKHPSSVEARLSLGQVHARMHSWKEAQAELLKLAKLDRNNSAALGLLGEVLMRRSDYDRAVPVLQHALSLRPANAELMGLLKRARDRTPLDPPGPIPRATDFDDEAITAVGREPGVSDNDAKQIKARDARPRPPAPPKPRAAKTVERGKVPVAVLPAKTRGVRGSRPAQAAKRPVAASPPPAAPPPAAPVNADDGEAYLNQLLHQGVKTRKKVAPVSAQELGIGVGSSRGTFIVLFVLLAVGAVGGATWHFVGESRRATAVAAHIAAADERLAIGTYEDYLVAAQELEKALLRDAADPTALSRLASTRAMALLMFGYGGVQEADITLIAAQRARKAADQDVAGQRDMAIAVAARALAVLGSVSDPGGVLSEAREAVDGALKVTPGDETLRWLDGMILMAEGKRDAARAAFKKSRTVPAAAIALADLDLDEGVPMLALKGYEAVLDRAKHPMASVGRDAVRAETWVVVPSIVTASRDRGDRIFAWQSLINANMSVQAGHIEEANSQLADAAGEKVGEPRFLIRFAMTQLALGHSADAEKKRNRIRYFGAALDQDPLLVTLDAHLFLARAMPKEALGILGDAKGAAAQIARGRALLDLGLPSKASAAFREALELAPEHGLALAYSDLARVLTKKNRSALRSLAGRARDTKSPLIAYLYGEAAMAMGKKRKAGKSLEIARNDSRFAHRALVKLASLYLQARRLKDAEAALREAIERAPSYLPAHAGLGHLYLRSGNSEAARDTFAKVVSSGRGSPGDELLYAQALFATEDIEGAKQAVRRAQAAGAEPAEVSRTAAMIDKAFVKALGLPTPR